MVQCRHPGGADMCWHDTAAACCPVASSTKHLRRDTPSDGPGSLPACVHQTISTRHQYLHDTTPAHIPLLADTVEY